MITASVVHALEDVKIIDKAQTEHFLQRGAVFIDNRSEYKFFRCHIKGASTFLISSLMTRKTG